jgi:hypothetical protein
VENDLAFTEITLLSDVAASATGVKLQMAINANLRGTSRERITGHGTA